ncbi:MAG: hypothetical protein HOP14_08620 [Acidobacteria bacterium]|nr:hypothetical protein [Acidobacteriota bacterium]
MMLRRNGAIGTAGTIASALPSVRFTPGPVATATGPQQLSHLPTRYPSEGADGGASARLAPGWVDAVAA